MFAALVGQDWADDAHPFSLEVNGIDRIASVPMESIRVEMAGPGTNGSLTFTIADPSAAIDVAAWAEVRLIEHAADQPLVFGGFVQSVRYTAWAAAGRNLEVQCVGYGVLLDKRISPTAFTPGYTDYVFFYDTYSHHPAMDVVSAVGLYGGRLSALCAITTFQGESTTDAEAYCENPYTVANLTVWWQDLLKADYTDGMSLRSIIETAINAGYYDNVDEGATYPAMAGLYWVNAYARVCVVPAMPSIATSGQREYQYETGATPVTITAGTTTGITGISYEVSGMDGVSAVYVLGATADSSGWYTTTPPERTGDLQAYVNDGREWDGILVNNVGEATVTEAGMDDARGEVEIVTGSVVNVTPGRRLSLTAAQIGLSAATFRITSVAIDYLGGAQRRYTIGYGGRVPGAPSFARRTGRYATI